MSGVKVRGEKCVEIKRAVIHGIVRAQSQRRFCTLSVPVLSGLRISGDGDQQPAVSINPQRAPPVLPVALHESHAHDLPRLFCSRRAG